MIDFSKPTYILISKGEAKVINFKPDYTLCNKPQKEVCHNVCNKIKKADYMYCGDTNNKCPAWDGYKYEGE